ncbi:MAG: serine hydrolase domain-containing protein [Candidatus Thorarchaeota archaeon]|jgi:CubicO group peptidase (beta-lactamase class C family)
MIEHRKPKQVFALSFAVIMLLVLIIGPRTVEATHIPFSNTELSIDSLIIVRNGYIVLEEYLNPAYNENTKHQIYSCTKSIISAMVGAALEEGLLASVDQEVLSFFPDQTFNNTDSRKENITLEDLLIMSAGLDWHELDVPYGTPANDFGKMYNSDNWVEYVLNKSMVEEPGEVWNYNSGTTHILSVILQNLTSTTPEVYFDWISSYICVPLGMTDIDWYTDPQGNYFGGAGMQVIPRDMAKFGYLYLNNGSWDGTQIIPEAWVEASSRGHAQISSTTHYGYQWWVYPTIGYYAAHGYAGQLIIVIPEYDMVAVFTSNIQQDSWPFPGLVADYIIPAARDGAGAAAPPISPYLIPAAVIIAAVAVVVLVVWRRKS